MGNTLFSSCYIGAQQRLYQHGVYILFKLCKFLWNILTNICSLGKCTKLKLGEVSSSFISNKITISGLQPLNSLIYRRVFFYCMTIKTIYYLHAFVSHLYLIFSFLPIVFQNHSLKKHSSNAVWQLMFCL